MKFWHYTTYPAFLDIWEDRKIKANFATAPLGRFEGPEVVWFSTNPIWEQSVRKAIQADENGETLKALSKEELFRRGHFPVRLRTNDRVSELVTWGNAKKQMKLKREYIKEIEEIAKTWDANIAEWWVSFASLPMSQILLPVEIWDGKGWVNIETFDFK